MTSEEFSELLAQCKLSSEDKEIATQRIVWRMQFIDIAACVHMDRRTVSRRLESVILQELDRMLNKRKEVGA